MRKIYYVLMLIMILFAGCRSTHTDPGSSEGQRIDFHPVQIVEQVTVSGDKYMEEKDIRPELTADDPYPVSHTLYDNSITFCDDVAVIMHDLIKSYDPSVQKITISNETDIGDALYAYVYYSESPSEFLFQRITEKEIWENGETVIRLSGVPLQSEMDNNEFLNLIKSINAYGDIEGSPVEPYEE